MINNTAFIFPAFITEYTNKELDFLRRNNIDIDDYIQVASQVIGEELPKFSYDSHDYKRGEFLSQVIAYLFSCAISDILQKSNIVPQITAGYSMGIYANLYAVNSMSLEDGIRLIKKAYELVNEISSTAEFGMGAIIGLTYNDVNKLITENQLDAEIINVNNEHSLVIAGKIKDIEILLNVAKEEGAFSVGKLTVKTPYHSKYLAQCASGFKDFVNEIHIQDAKVPVISTYNQRFFSDVKEIKKELVYNLTEKINWYDTMKKILEGNVNVFYECGAGKDLSKIARFIDGEYEIKTVYNI